MVLTRLDGHANLLNAAQSLHEKAADPKHDRFELQQASPGKPLYTAAMREGISLKSIGSALLHGNIKQAASMALEKIGQGDSALAQKLDPSKEKISDFSILKEMALNLIVKNAKQAGVKLDMVSTHIMLNTCCESVHNPKNMTVSELLNFAKQVNNMSSGLGSAGGQAAAEVTTELSVNNEVNEARAPTTYTGTVGNGQSVEWSAVTAQVEGQEHEYGLLEKKTSVSQQAPADDGSYEMLQPIAHDPDKWMAAITKDSGDYAELSAVTQPGEGYYDPVPTADYQNVEFLDQPDVDLLEEDLYVTPLSSESEKAPQFKHVTPEEMENYSAKRRAELGIANEGDVYSEKQEAADLSIRAERLRQEFR